ncbi:MAG: ABC transporter permease [Candidatus Latescibacteria bacterium]|nr:ABC transporter permease [Candidatus Latescibacterota bacterium]
MFLRFLGRQTLRFLWHLGGFSLLVFRTILALREGSTYFKLTFQQMVRIGVRSLPIVIYISGFTGMVTSVQAAYQFSNYIPLYLVGSVVGKSVLLELAPVLTALILSGRVGATIAAEIGTMKVTEQIDALESLAFNSVAYLVVPRVIAGMVMMPVLTIFSDAVGIAGGLFSAMASVGITQAEFWKGLRMFFELRDAYYGLAKASCFGLIITFIGCYEGYHSGQGAEGVGTAATNTVVVSCLLILMFDYVLAEVLLR